MLRAGMVPNCTNKVHLKAKNMKEQSQKQVGKGGAGGRVSRAADVLLIGQFASSTCAGLTASATLQTAAPTNIRPSEITTLEITLSNNNSLAAITAAAFSNSLPGVLPSGLKVAGAPTYTCFNPVTSTTSAGDGTLTAALRTQPIQLSGGVIPARNRIHEISKMAGGK
jgi:hypothetical protein